MLRSLGVEDLDRPDTREIEDSMREQQIIMTDPVSRPATLDIAAMQHP